MSYADLISAYVFPLSPIPTDARPGGRLIKPLNAVLFDVYGTLLASQAGDVSSMARNDTETATRIDSLLENYNYKGSAKELIADFLQAISAAHESMRRKGTDWPEVEIERVWKQVLDVPAIETARRFSIEFEMIANPCYPMPHLANVFSSFREKGVKMGIISNAQFFTPLMFEVLCGGRPENLGFTESLVFYSYRFGVAKPSRRLFQLAARELDRLGIEIETTLYVGNDILNDILPARADGFQTALFAGDNRSLRKRSDDPRCADVKPDLVITDWRQIIEWIGP